MTQSFIHVPAQNSRFSGVVIGTLTSAVIVLAGLLSFAPYSLM